ncbi:MAG TPA: retropepsin-like aspartic protease [Burkholderiales bacterium]|nr:retropepsin-like aspartic protease [Burkholderiales bacterium]
MAWLRTAWFAIGMLAAGCAVPPERTEREVALRSAIEPCLKRYPSVKLTGIDAYGRVYARAPEHDNVEGFEQCSKEAIEREGLALTGTGKLSGSAAPATVAIRSAYSAFLVPVKINGISATLVLDTGASQTLIRPELARRAGLEIAWGARMMRGNVVGGRVVSVPLVRARSVSVGAAAVEDIDVGVFDALPGRPEVDGLLGASFLVHFRFTVDRKNLQLLLEPVSTEK